MESTDTVNSPVSAKDLLRKIDQEDIEFHEFMLRCERPGSYPFYIEWVKERLREFSEAPRKKNWPGRGEYSEPIQNSKYGPRPDLDFGAYCDRAQGRKFIF